MGRRFDPRNLDTLAPRKRWKCRCGDMNELVDLTCPSCDRNAPKWARELGRRLRGEGVRHG